MKLLKISLFVIFDIMLLLMFLTYKNHQSNMSKEHSINQIPPFSLKDVKKGEYITDKNVSSNNITVLVFFDADCENCEAQADEFYRNRDLIKNTKILFISKNYGKVIRNFSIKHKLSEMPNMIFLSDSTGAFIKHFGTLVTPSSFVYRRQRLFKKVYGQTKISYLMSEIR